MTAVFYITWHKMTPSWPKIMFCCHPCLFLKIYSLSSSFTGAPVLNTVNKMYSAYFFFLYILRLLNIHIWKNNTNVTTQLRSNKSESPVLVPKLWHFYAYQLRVDIRQQSVLLEMLYIFNGIMISYVNTFVHIS